jgi:hypothetical protein
VRNVWRVYIKPFDDLGVYQDWIDVSTDVVFDAMGSLNTDLDNTDYDIGVYRVSNFKITLQNNKGRYSDVGSDQTIFKYKRSDSLVKITWEVEVDGPVVGIATSGSGFLSEEATVFTGLLNDDSLSMDLSKQQVSFTCLGRESWFQREIVPFGSIHVGDTYAQVIYAILNQTTVTTLLNVDVANINCGLNNTIDSISSLQNKTIQEGLNKLLLASNSVLYIQDDDVIVAPRQATPAVMFTFYGQGSPRGQENIADLKNIRNGLNRTYNYITWKDTTLYSSDITSVSKYGIRKKEVDFEFTTDSTKQQSVLDALATEFKLPKQEFDVYTPLRYESLAVNLLDRVSVDYPRVYVSGNIPLPICGVCIAGEAVFPTALWAFAVSADDHYKIIGKSLDIKNATIKFKARLI